jgi:acyl carrier protein phosphodiesterase
MNFLAHLYLSGSDENLMVGNFLADFLSNREILRMPDGIKAGIKLHRKIDSFTDGHEFVHKSVKRLRPVHRKYAPVILDVLYDFVLANNWDLYSKTPLHTFTANAYEVLLNHLYLMPALLQERLPLMVSDDWLVRYGTEEGLRFTFSRMKLRSQHPRFFDNAVDSFTKDYLLYQEEFNAFFPELIAYVRSEGLKY